MGAKSLPAAAPAAGPGLGVDGQLADRALRALLKHHESSSSSANDLLGNDLDVQVQFSLARIPGNASPKPMRIDIPHPMFKLASSTDDDDDAMDDDEDDHLQEVEACLIVKEESKPWVQDLVARFPAELSCIKKVLGLQSLRTKHKSYTQRRALLERFDVFFADDRILPMLTKALGGKFFEKKKQPIPVRLTRKEALPFAIRKCLRGTFMCLSAGTCVTVKAGNTAMPPSKLLSNIRAICDDVPTKVPRKWSNIRAVSIKTTSSVALPIYNKTPEELEEIMKLARENKEIEEKEEKEGTKDGEGSKRKTAAAAAAANSKLAKALKKQRAAEKAKDAEEEVVENPSKSSKKKKRKQSMDETEGTAANALETPKPAGQEVKEETGAAEATEAASTKTPKSSKRKKKRKGANVEIKEEEAANVKEANVEIKEEETPKGKETTDRADGAEVAKTPAKTPKSSKRKKKRKGASEEGAEEESTVTKETETPKSTKRRKAKPDETPAAPASSKKATKVAPNESPAKDAKFVSSRKFSGAKKGYVFKKGRLGTGYYKDVLPVVDEGWLAGLGNKAGRGGGRKSMGHGMKKRKGGRSSRTSY